MIRKAKTRSWLCPPGGTSSAHTQRCTRTQLPSKCLGAALFPTPSMPRGCGGCGPLAPAEISDPPAGASLPPGASLAHPAPHLSVDSASCLASLLTSCKPLLTHRSPLSLVFSFIPSCSLRPLFQLSLPFFVFQMQMIMVIIPILQASLEAKVSGYTE